MNLIDASVIFDHTRNKDPRLVGWFKQYQPAVCGITRMEVLHGSRGPRDRRKLLTFLNRFIQAPSPETIWDQVGHNLTLLRSNGLTIPVPDVILATVAIHHDLEVWARDHHFPLMQKWLPALKLFQEPA